MPRYLLLLLLACAGPAGAADLQVVIADQAGRPVADAVVSVLPEAGTPVARPPATRTRTIDQVALQFVPYIEVLRPGDRVVFRNSDQTRHHVYSFSQVKAFEFVLAPGESSKPLLLDKPGVVAVGCNIHDSMIAYLYVTEAAITAVSGADGQAVLHGLAPGRYVLRAWQPRLRPGKPDLVQSVVLVGDHRQTARFTLPLLPDARRQFDREHTRY
jgi:plastocyanin